jgi:hypothetical protein
MQTDAIEIAVVACFWCRLCGCTSGLESWATDGPMGTQAETQRRSRRRAALCWWLGRALISAVR